MKNLSLSAMLLLGATSPLLGQAAASCSAAPAMSIDSLRTLAATLHPNAILPGLRDSSVAVALVFDSNCRLVNHAVVQRPWGEANVSLLGPLVPQTPDSALGAAAISSGGVAELLVPARTDVQRGGAAVPDPSRPWLIWGILRVSGG